MSEIMVGKALSTNSFTAASTSAGYINPDIWRAQIEDFAKAKLVVAPLGVNETGLLGAAGDSLKVQFAASVTAAAVAETASITPSAITYTQVTYTPSEKAVAIALTRKERIRAINDIMMDKTKDMGYALAKLKDSLILTELQSSATTSLISNGVALSALASTDTFNTDLIANGVSSMESLDYQPKYLIVHPKCKNTLIKSSQFVDASIYGGRETVLNGEIGQYLGLKVLTTTLIPANATKTDAYDNFILGDRAFGVAMKMGVTFNSDYDVFTREFKLAAVEDYDIKALHTSAIVKLTAWKGL